ncbi:HEPN domain-containing protein [Vulcanisaeta distributa]|uniref:HEPN domain-containing protein n=1 Tax=Vulcanisaeta distributa TaxID=164451 RepID=UPI0006D2C593|nr:HEPN domain-containing protein [Vulcanisaeta distributa]
MREEAEQWLREAIRELELARHLLEIGYLNYAAFHSHQAAEKALKALIIVRLRLLPPKTHLLELAERLRSSGIPVDEVIDYLRDLNPHYLVARYPDAANGVPSEVYSKREAQHCVESASRVIEWVKKLLVS